MDLFHFEFMPDKQIKMPAIIVHDSEQSIHKNDLLFEINEMDCQPTIRVYDTSVTEGPVTVSCYLKVARHVQ